MYDENVHLYLQNIRIKIKVRDLMMKLEQEQVFELNRI